MSRLDHAGFGNDGSIGVVQPSDAVQGRYDGVLAQPARAVWRRCSRSP